MIRRIALVLFACGIAASAAGAAPQPARNGLVVFASDRAENYPYPQVYAIRAAGSKRLRLSQEAAWGPPSWAPNGRAIVFPTIDDVVIASANGRTQQKLHAPRSFGASGDVSWSPDGRRIAIANEGGPLYVKTLGGSIKQLTRREALWPSWSPSGRQIAYVLAREFQPDLLMVVGFNGHGRRRIARWGEGLRPSWSPDGRDLVVADAGITRLNVRTVRRSRITRRAGDSNPIWSPDGSRIAFQRQRGRSDTDIFSIHADGTGLARLTHNHINEAWLAWSPDGHRLAYVGRHSDVFVVGRDGGRTRRISRQPCGEGANWLTWSPRGDLVAFGASSGQRTEIFTTDASGARVKQVTRGCRSRKEHPAWSPTGEEIAFDNGLGGGGDIFVANKDGSAARNLTRGSAWETDPSWSPDATQLVFVSRVPDRPAHIFTMRADGTDKRQIADGDWNASPSWSPRGDRIAFAGRRDGPGIYLMNPDGSNVVRLTSHGESEPSWSPDASRITFVRDYDIWTMNADGTSPIRLTERDGYTAARSPSWSGDGTRIVFSADIDGGRGSDYALFTVNSSGGDLQFLAYAPVNSIDPDWQRLP